MIGRWVGARAGQLTYAKIYDWRTSPEAIRALVKAWCIGAVCGFLTACAMGVGVLELPDLPSVPDVRPTVRPSGSGGDTGCERNVFTGECREQR